MTQLFGLPIIHLKKNIFDRVETESDKGGGNLQSKLVLWKMGNQKFENR